MTDENDFSLPDMTAFTSSEAMDVVEVTLDKFLETSRIDMVYGEPYEHGDTLIIPCSESFTALGMGAGGGGGSSPAQDGEAPGGVSTGNGGGGGGGGRTFARPVAVIVSSPEGVRIEPVVDITKIALAALTAFGFMVGMTSRMMNPRRARRAISGE